MKAISLVMAVGVLFLVGCKDDPNTKMADPAQTALNDIRAEYAPDKRVALFDVAIDNRDDKMVLKGESNLPEAVAALRARLDTDSIPYTDSIQQLPAATLGKKRKAIVNISVANLRSKPAHSAELATQAILGTILKVYKHEGDWYLVQTPDNYLAWVDAGAIELVEEQIAENWELDDKIMYTRTYGHAYADPYRDSLIVSDLTAGNMLSIVKNTFNNYMVRFPDGRNAYVRKSESKEYSDWLTNLNATDTTLVETAKQLMGVPYLWGGTSTKGVDCSGFTKTIYFLNGMIIPRDASQQVNTGVFIDSTRNFDALKRGDLLFFGRKATDSTKEKVVHVGMWIGNDEFIHSSDMVRVSSMNKNSKNYDEHNLNRYLRSKRLFKQKGPGLQYMELGQDLKD